MTLTNSGPAPESLESAGSRARKHEPRGNNTTGGPLLQAALAIARRRPVFPCNIEKRPLVDGGFKAATTDPATIEKWWTDHPNALIGSPTGGTHFVLDIDLPHGPAALEALEAEHGPLPATLEQKTGGGGRQLFFKMPPGADIRNSTSKIGHGLDIRGNGGYVILPPSRHKSGGRYEWQNREQMADAPAWLVEEVSKKPDKPTRTATGTGLDPYAEKAFRDALGAVMRAPEGTRNEELNKQAHGLYGLAQAGRLDEQEVTSQLAQAAVVVGLYPPEINATLKSACQAAVPRVAEGAQETRNEIVGNISTPNSSHRHLAFAPASDLTCFQEPTRWVVKGLIEAGNLAGLISPPEHYKTFVAIDLGCCIAAEKDWHGSKVEGGPVLYLCGEGRRGIGRRLQAWEQHNRAKADRFFVSSTSAQLLDSSNLAELEAAADEVVAQHGLPALVIVDTLNRNFGPGDENSTTDMTRFIAALDRLRDRLQCAILIVHHTGLADTGRGRGNSALRGALDFEYQLTKNQDQNIELSCSKAKDHERPPTIAFKPVAVDLGMVDEDMRRPVTSLVLERTQVTTKSTRKRLTAPQKIALDALKAVVDETGKTHLDTWRNEAYSRGISPTGTADAKQKAFQRAVTGLLAAGIIEARDNIFWCTGQPRTYPDKNRTCPPVSGESSRTDTDICLKTMSGVRPFDTAETVTVEI